MSRFQPHLIRFCLRAFATEAERPISHKFLRVLLNALTAIDVYYLRANPGCPPLYSSGVRYEEEPIGQEDWCEIQTVLQQGWGDCEDLACWRCAEIIVKGERARAHDPSAPAVHSLPIFRWRRLNESTTLYHILCLHDIAGKRTIEDPSRILGMGSQPSQYTQLVRRPPLLSAAGWPPVWAA